MSSPPRSPPDLDRLRIDRAGRRKSGGRKYVVMVVVVLAGSAAWYFKDRLPTLDGSTPRPTPRTATVTERSPSEFLGSGTSSNGHVIARRKAALSTIIPGLLVEMTVEEGSVVSAGQAVARIQYDDYAKNLEQAERAIGVTGADKTTAAILVEVAKRSHEEARVAVTVQERLVAEADVATEAARRDLERNRPSHAEGTISEAEWDAYQTAMQGATARGETARARVEHARSQAAAAERQVAQRQAEIDRFDAVLGQQRSARDQAAIDLEKTYIRAPFAGTIVLKNAEEGEVVAATSAGGNSRGSVATLVDMSTLEVQVELNENRLGPIVEGSPATVYLDIEPTRGHPGHVRQVWPTADRQKGTIEIRVVFEHPPASLRPELGARVVFPDPAAATTTAAPVKVVPAAAVRQVGDETIVWRVVDGRLRRTVVTTAARLGDAIVIVAGLDTGAVVLVDGLDGIRDGDTLNRQ